jgi:hypothetical protein
MCSVPRIFWKFIFFVCYGIHGIFIPNYRFTVDTCCDADFLIFDNSRTFNLVKQETLIEETCSVPRTINLLLIGNFIPTYFPHLVYNQYLLGTMMGCRFFHSEYSKIFNLLLRKNMNLQFLQEIKDAQTLVT